MGNEPVAILLAAYNGEKYIAQQLESILGQTYLDWTLFVRIDVSTDETLRIVTQYAQNDQRIKIVYNDGQGSGASYNFGALMAFVAKNSNYSYIMFSDQDDKWLENKVELSVSSMKDMITDLGTDVPILIHTDFHYADSALNILPVKENIATKMVCVVDKLRVIVNDNYIFGCTMIINRALLNLSVPVAESAENHDFWIALHASAFGQIKFVNEKTMMYRQHSSNVSGGVQYSSIRNRILRIISFNSYISNKNKRLKQFEAFFEKEQGRFSNESIKILTEYIYHSKTGGIKAVVFMIKNHFKLRGPMQTLMYYISLFKDSK